MDKLELVLASSSDIRKEIISRYKISYIVASHKFNEEEAKIDTKLRPKDLSMYLASYPEEPMN